MRGGVLGLTGSDWRVVGKRGKMWYIIAVPPTKGPCPHGLFACPPPSDRLLALIKHISSMGSVQVSLVEFLFKVQVLVSILQHVWPIVRVNVISVLPGIVFLREVRPADLELEVISEPVGIYILLHDPVVLIIDLDWQQWQVLAVRYRVRLGLG